MSPFFIMMISFFSLNVNAFTISGTGNSDLKGWQTKELSFSLNPANCPSTIRSQIADAMDLWNSVPTSSLKLSLGADTAVTAAQATAGTNITTPVIICDSNFNTTLNETGDSGTLGVGTFTSSSKTINGGYLLLNVDSTHSPTKSILTLSSTEVTIAMAHEIGHVLGLGHSSYEPALMYYSLGHKEKLNLAQDDMDGLSYLYPRSEPKDKVFGCGTTSLPLRPPSSPGGNAFLFFFWFLMIPYYSVKFRKNKIRIKI